MTSKNYLKPNKPNQKHVHGDVHHSHPKITYYKASQTPQSYICYKGERERERKRKACIKQVNLVMNSILKERERENNTSNKSTLVMNSILGSNFHKILNR